MRLLFKCSLAILHFNLVTLISATPILPWSETSPADSEDVIPGKYIVTLHPRSTLHHHLSKRYPESDSTGILNAESFSIGDALQGYTTSIAHPTSVSALTADPDVLSIEPDRIIRNNDHSTKTKRALVTQSPIPNWGLGRISHRAPGAEEYVYDDIAGNGTWAYVIDTGIYAQHEQFALGTVGYPGFNSVPGETIRDENGHGTAIAGIIAGADTGVAKHTHLVPIKVLNRAGSGSISAVIRGMQWAYHDAQTHGRLHRSVLHFSLGGFHSPTLNRAATAAVEGGLMVVAAAGGEYVPANSSPGSARGVLVVGASTREDERAPESRLGSVYAPGVDITTAGIETVDAERVMQGTTAAAGFVTGVALCFMGMSAAGEEMTPEEVVGRIVELSTKTAGGVNVVYNGSGL